LEIAFFIPSNTFLGVLKLHIRKKILGTLGDALRSGGFEAREEGCCNLRCGQAFGTK
jgi:hypothetical protein